MKSKLNITARRNARCLALQALYQWLLTGEQPDVINEQFEKYHKTQKTDLSYFQELLFKVPANIEEIDKHFSHYLDRPIAQLNSIELTTIRMAVYELAKRPDIPYKVVINEALELNKTFGTIEGYKYVNGILDKVAHCIRADEIKKSK